MLFVSGSSRRTNSASRSIDPMLACKSLPRSAVIKFVSRKEISVNVRRSRTGRVGTISSNFTRLQIIFDHRFDINSRLSKIIVNKFYLSLGINVRGIKCDRLQTANINIVAEPKNVRKNAKKRLVGPLRWRPGNCKAPKLETALYQFEIFTRIKVAGIGCGRPLRIGLNDIEAQLTAHKIRTAVAGKMLHPLIFEQL